MQDGYNDYDQHHDDDDTICYLLKNIKFKLNYMRIYWERNENWGLRRYNNTERESRSRKKSISDEKKPERHLTLEILGIRQTVSRGMQIQKRLIRRRAKKSNNKVRVLASIRIAYARQIGKILKGKLFKYGVGV